MYMVDLKQAFDRIRLIGIIKILNDHDLDIKDIRIIIDLKNNSRTRIKVNQKVAIKDVKREGTGYRIGNKSLKILCYEDDTKLIAEDEEHMHIFQI